MQAQGNRNRPQTEEPTKLTNRGVFLFFCMIPAFYSVALGAFGLMMSGQILEDDIPEGVVRSAEVKTKIGYHLIFEDGHQADFRSYIAYRGSEQTVPRAGDRVAKRSGSAVYYFNGRPITDARWLVSTYLLPIHQIVLIAVYFLLGGLYVAVYRRSPIADAFRKKSRDRPAATGRNLVGALGALVGAWLAAMLGLVVFFGCCGLGGAGILRWAIGLRGG